MTGQYIIDGINLAENPEGPDNGPFREVWHKKHRIAYQEIPYFRDKTILTSGVDPLKEVDGVVSGGQGGSGTLWFTEFSVKSISEVRFQFFKALSEKAGPHILNFPFGYYVMYLEDAQFEVEYGYRDGTTSDAHYISGQYTSVPEHVGTWTFKMVEWSH